LQRAFPVDVLMVYSPKLFIVANDNNLTAIGLALGKTIYFGSLEFITDHFSRMSLSPREADSGVVFMGMVHNGHPLCTLPLRSPPMRVMQPWAKEGALDLSAPEGAM
jgi:hypothetical protein